MILTPKEEMLEIADRIGDLPLMELFWDMFNGLSQAKQKLYVIKAKEIERNKR